MMKDVQLKQNHVRYPNSISDLEKMFDDGEYVSDKEFLKSYEYVETNDEGHEIWHLKPHVQKQIKDKYGL
ncbi:MAG: hypothetical protein E6355_04525 [Streptococcus mitis]|nr:hypothetical protein [Streptococcus mitis]